MPRGKCTGSLRIDASKLNRCSRTSRTSGSDLTLRRRCSSIDLTLRRLGIPYLEVSCSVRREMCHGVNRNPPKQA